MKCGFCDMQEDDMVRCKECNETYCQSCAECDDCYVRNKEDAIDQAWQDTFESIDIKKSV